MNRSTPIHGDAQPETSGAAQGIHRAITVGIDQRGIARAIGRELSRARLDLGWARAMAAGLAGISTSTLDASEAGVRPCSLLTLIKRCWSMAIAPPDLLELAMQRQLINPDMISLLVDLHAVVRDPTPPDPVRRWAIAHLDHDQHHYGAIRLPPSTVAEVARALEVKHATLISYLARRAPHSVRGSAHHPGRTIPDPPRALNVTTDCLAQALGVVLRDLRTERGWTQLDVVDQLPARCHIRTWCSYERGEAISGIARLIEVGRLFTTPAPILLGRAIHRLGLGGSDAVDVPGGGADAGRPPSQAHGEVEP